MYQHNLKYFGSNIKEFNMNIQLRRETVEALNLQYKTHNFQSNMTATEMIHFTETAMRSFIDVIDYELTGQIIEKYGIKIKYCEDDPFTITEREEINQFIVLVQKLLASFGQTSVVINSRLEQLKDYVVKYGTKLQLSHKYHKYLLYFKRISVKQAIIFETLSKCQIFYTITRERKKSGKEYYMDPLIKCFQQIKQKLGILYPFNESVLPKKQLRFFEKKNTDKKMKNVLFEAVSNQKHKEIRELIAKGASIEEPGILQRHQLRQMNCSHRACQLGDLETCKILHSYKVNWEARQKEGMTSLHFAVQSGNLQLVIFLIEVAKADFQAKDIQERTPFYFACTEGDLNTIRYLYEKGCNINNQSKLGRSALSKACYLGLVDVVTFLMSCPGIILETQDGKGRTALHNAVFGPKGGRQGHKFGTNEKDSPQCTQLLLEKGFDVDYLDKEQNTPLHVSMSSDGIDSIRVLLAFGGSLKKLNCYGETPLLTGAKFGHLQSVKILRQEFKSSLTVKDIFNKNLMLLCAKFRQDEGASINRVFYYSTDELLLMAKHRQPLQIGENFIKNWQQQIDYTFNELLKEHSRADQQFKYFCLKCKELNLQITQLTLEQIKKLLDLIKNNDNKVYLQIVEYFICQRSHESKLSIKIQELKQFVKWILLENSITLLQFIGKIQYKLKQYLIIENYNVQFSFLEYLSTSFFSLISQLKQKVLTYCLLKLNINWLQYIQTQNNYNIIHLLVRSKKIGSLIQVLKVLSGVRLDFITNNYIINICNEEDIFRKNEEKGESPLQIILKNMLIYKDRQGFDPYHLALLLKDASASKLLEEKVNKQAGFNKSQFQVKQYSLVIETNPIELQAFNKGYQLEDELQRLIQFIEKASNKNQISQCFSLLQTQSKQLAINADIDTFKKHWKDFSNRKIIEISEISQVSVLTQLQKQSVLGIDIEYFYSEGATLISIMQISSLRHDYIIDFLSSAKQHELFEQFTQAVRKALIGVAHNNKIMKIMHGSDNDLCVIRSVLKFSFLNFLDTARVDVQLRKQQNIRGLATLVKQYLNQHMSKDYQVSEWRIRPIPSSMIQYARRDSFVLPFLAKAMLNLLPQESLRQVLLGGCRQARRNKKTSQPLIKSIQAL